MPLRDRDVEKKMPSLIHIFVKYFILQITPGGLTNVHTITAGALSQLLMSRKVRLGFVATIIIFCHYAKYVSRICVTRL